MFKYLQLIVKSTSFRRSTKVFSLLTLGSFRYLILLQIGFLLFCGSVSNAQVTYVWRNEATNGNWNEANNWWRGYVEVPGGNEVLSFQNNNQLTTLNNLANTSRFRIVFQNTANNSRTLNGVTANTFFDFGGNPPAILNNSGVNHTINFPIVNGNTSGTNRLEFNASNGNLTIGSTISGNGGTRNIVAMGASNIFFNGVISNGSATINFIKEGSGTASFGSSNTYTGTTTITGGTLSLVASAVLPTTNTVTINGGTLIIANASALTNNNNITLTAGTLALGAVASASTTNVGTVAISPNTGWDLSAAPASCSLVVANTSGLASGNLTITGWIPTKRIIITNIAHITGAGILGRINFFGYGVGAKIINGNELVPQLLFVTNGTSGGNFNNPASWLNSDPPTANTGTESIFIQPGDVLTQNTNFNVLNAQIGGTLTMNAVNSLTVSGTATHSGTINMVNGSVINLVDGATWARTTGGSFAGSPQGRIHFLGNGTVTGTVTFPDVVIDGAVNFGTGSTIGGSSSLTINPFASVLTNAPTYASGSTLIYNTTSGYNRNDEWKSGTTGPGIPHHVRINAGATLNLDVTPGYQNGDGRTLLGNLDIYGTLTMGGTVAAGGSMDESLVVGGNLTIRNTGSLTLGCQRPALSTTGDLYLGGDWTHETGGVFNGSQRAVFFNGNNALQTVNYSGEEDFPYFIITKPGNGSVRLNCDLRVTGTNKGHTLQLYDGNLDLNGRTLTFISYVFFGGEESQHKIKIEGTPGNLTRRIFNSSSTAANFIFTHSDFSTRIVPVERNSPNASLLSFGENVVVQISRTAAGTSGVDFGNTITTINGTLQINSGGFVSVNPPTYTDNSLLRYNTGGDYNRSVEWSTASSGPGHPFNVQISKPGVPQTRLIAGPTVAYSTTALNLRGSLTIDAGNTFDMTNAAGGTATNMAVPLTAGLDINISGTLIASQNTNGNIILGRNWTRNSGGVFTHNNRSVTFTTANLSVINAPSPATTETFHSLIISKTAAANTVTLASPVQIDNSLSLNTGIVITRANPLPPLYTSPTFLLTLIDNATSSTGSAASFVSGPMRKIGNDAFTFPVGKYIGGEFHWRTIGISAQSNVAEEITAEFWRDNPLNRGAISPAAAAASPGLSHISRCEYWDLTKTTAALDVNVTLSWSNNPLGKSNCNVAKPNLVYVDNLSELVVVPYYNGMWGDQNSAYFGQSSAPGPANPVSPALGFITWNGGAALIDTYLKFTLGSTNWRYNPLPFDLIKFDGKARSNDVILDWTVNGNDEQKEYLLERSSDGVNFVRVARIPAISDLKVASYSAIDTEPFSGLNFYRLTAFSHAGEFKKSQTIQVWFGSKSGKPGIYPNPIVNNQVNIHTNGLPKGVYNIQLVGMDGKLLLQQRWVNNGNQPVYQLQLNPALPRGMYWITIAGDQGEPVQLKILK